MKYWIYIGGKEAEIQQGHIWQPKTLKNLRSNKSFETISAIRPGDIIYWYSKGYLRKVGLCELRAEERCRKNEGLGKIALVEWDIPIRPIKISRETEALVELVDWTVRQPFRKGSLVVKENQHGLFELGNSVGKKLGERLSRKPDLRQTPSGLEFLNNEILQDIEDDESTDDETKSHLVQSRTGQGRYKFNLSQIEAGCRISGIKDLRFLIASHIKPWRSCDNEERLDGNNGLLLVPNLDKLFDRGYISFEDDGKVIRSNFIAKRTLSSLGLNLEQTNSVGPFNPKQAEYLAHHREFIFLR